MESFSFLLANCTQIVGKIIHMLCKKCTFTLILDPSIWKAWSRLSTRSLQLSALVLPKKLVTTAANAFHASSSVDCIVLMKAGLFNSLRSIEYTSFEFFLCDGGKFHAQVLETVSFLAQCLYKLLHEAKFDVQWREKNFLWFQQWFILGSFLPPTNSVCLGHVLPTGLLLHGCPTNKESRDTLSILLVVPEACAQFSNLHKFSSCALNTLTSQS